ncbi:MAG: acyl-CoA thioesterase [Acidimicrobiia bacterium]
MPYVDDITALLELRQVGPMTYEAVNFSGATGHLFGGHVTSQALRAASLTVDKDRFPNSIHAYFLRAGDPEVPLFYEVENTRDGRSISTRRVRAIQHGVEILSAMASFHVHEDAVDWTRPRAEVPPPPDALLDVRAPVLDFDIVAPWDIRSAAPLSPTGYGPYHPFWVRHRKQLPDDRTVNACALAFVSDMAVTMTAPPPGMDFQSFWNSTIDHSLWIHRPLRFDEWHVFSVASITTSGSRALAQGSFHTQDGVLVASISQEVLARPGKARPIETPK